MKSWEDDRPVYEKELTPQQKEEEAIAAKARMKKVYERGRRMIFVMMSLYVGMVILSLLLKVFVIADAGQGLGNLLLGLPVLGFALIIAYNLYNGKVWAKVVFSTLLGLTILSLLLNMASLDIGRTDYSSQSSNTWVYSNGEMVESWKLGEAELTKMQDRENMRAMEHRVVMGVDLIFLAVLVSYFYLLYGYHPVKEFLYGQETKGYGNW